MARMRRKADLPSKTCLVCARPFIWRKKWARDWDQVKYCSDRCRAAAPQQRETFDSRTEQLPLPGFVARSTR